jgi:nucleoid-associated protein YgaU
LGQIVTRGRKLFVVGAILAIGLVLAWPFRKADGDLEHSPSFALPPGDILRASNGDPIAALRTAAPQADIPVSAGQVVAQMAATNPLGKDLKASRPLESFDLANHPALIQTASVPIDDPPPPPQDAAPGVVQPTYDTGPLAVDDSIEEWPAELMHVVANGDTLEKLAERYLGDAGRALEIFDLNRDQLSNPHLLPIGVELRVPRNPQRIVD